MWGMSNKLSIAVLLFSFAMGCLSTYLIMKDGKPEAPRTITKYLPATDLLSFEESWDYTPPTYRFVFNQSDSKPEVVEKKIYVPVNYGNDFTLSQRDPIDIGRNSVKFRYYDPAIQSEVIDEFEFTDRRLRFGIYVDSFVPLVEVFGKIRDMRPVVGPRVQLNYRGIGLGVGSYYSFSEEKFHPFVRASIQLN